MHPIPNPYAKTKLSALLHSYSVLKLCTYANYLPLKTIAKHHELLRPILKHTLFKKFAGAENLVELTSLKTELNGRGIKCILDLAIEADLDTISTDATFDQVLARLLETIQSSQNSFVAIKATALGHPQALQRVSAACNYALHQYDLLVTNDCPISLEIVRKWLNTLPGHSSISEKDILDVCNALQKQNPDASPMFVVNPAKQKEWFIGSIPSTPTSITGELALADLEDFDNIQRRFLQLIEEAKSSNAKLMLDAEQTYFQPAIDLLHLSSPIFDYPVVYNTYQMYLTSSPLRLERDLATRKMGVKLVRGAYMHQEREYAAQHNLLDPVHKTASDTHAAYDAGARMLKEKGTSVVLATHNWSSIQKALDNPNAGFAQLYGMGDWMTVEVARRGVPSYKYVPYGSVHETVPYLLRRAQENSSILGGVGIDLAYLRAAIRQRVFPHPLREKSIPKDPTTPAQLT